MCGIAGYIGTRVISPESIDRCLSFMQRRGPDASGFYRSVGPGGHNILMLHSRLKIIDLNERANQPFRIGSKVMVYNGEIYNYLELRKEFSDKFLTESDTEVLLQVICRNGWKGLDKCEGMWAFAVYDEQDGSLLLSRDRFCEKPLYLYRDSSGMYFGSEIKFISALLGDRLNVNYNHLFRYIVNGYKALYKVKETFFEGLEELPGASILIVDKDGNEDQKRYWRPSFVQDEAMSYKEAVSGVREYLIQSVRLRLRADVPLAFCMSGGVDSNALIGIARNVFNYDVHGFTLVNNDARYEEQEMVDHSVSELGIRHTSIPIRTDNFISSLRDLIRYHDTPVYTVSYYVHWMLMQSIKENNYRISISGTAADELFSGYYDHHNAYLYEVRNISHLFEESLKNWNTHVKPIVRNPYLGDPKAFIKNPGMREHIYLDADKFSGYLRSNWAEPFYEEAYTDSLLRNRMLNELFHESIPVILHEDDLNAMYYSIENRSPFLDRNLFEFAIRIPTRHLIRDGMAKAVLRDAMRGIVPEKILTNRRKVGFNAPILDLLDTRDKAVRSYVLGDGAIYDYVIRERIDDLFNKPYLPNSESKFLFNFLNAKIFLDEFHGGMAS
jgi:asparagine synthase (glutamine-hydrolysing)